MNDRDQRRYDRFTRVQTFGRENAGEFATGGKAKTQFAAIDALIGQLLEKAGKDVQELDAIMNNKYARQPEKLRAWQSASRIERAPQREKKS